MSKLFLFRSFWVRRGRLCMTGDSTGQFHRHSSSQTVLTFPYITARDFLSPNLPAGVQYYGGPS